MYSDKFQLIDARPKAFYQIDNELMTIYATQKLISPSEVAVYNSLSCMSNKFNTCFPSIDTLANMSNVSKRKVYECIELLEKLKLVSVNRTGKNNVYTLLPVKKENNNISTKALSTNQGDFFAPFWKRGLLDKSVIVFQLFYKWQPHLQKLFNEKDVTLIYYFEIIDKLLKPLELATIKEAMKTVETAKHYQEGEFKSIEWLFNIDKPVSNISQTVAKIRKLANKTDNFHQEYPHIEDYS